MNACTARTVYTVHYYDPSKRGTWVRQFDNREDADKFASLHRLYAKPCQVKEAIEEGGQP